MTKLFSPRKGTRHSDRVLRAAAPTHGLYLQALEPRVLLDAAAAKTVQDAAQAPSAPSAPDAHDHHVDLVNALAAVQRQQAAPAAAEPARTEVYFIDRSVADANVLAQNLPANAEVHFIEPQVDGVEFIAQTLQGRSDISAIHILSHGEAGALQLGTASLTTEYMQADYRDELAAIGRSLTASGDILIYGCDFGQGSAGSAAVETLASLTGADVAASTDDTGAASLGGDWVLERQTGTVETTAVSAEAWDQLMTAPVLSTTPALAYTAAEDAPAPVAGTAVGVLVSTYTVGMTDADAGALEGIAITANVATNGVWWYTQDAGATWTQVGTVSASSALLLADNASTRLYYQVTTADFTGSAGNALTIRGWDQSLGTVGTKVNPTTITGAISTASDTVAVTVTAANDAPVLTTTNFSIASLQEDLNQSTAVKSPNVEPRAGLGVTSANLSLSGSDADTGATTPPGMAIVGVDNTHGQWSYSTDTGATYTAMTNLSDANAVLLDRVSTSRLFFQPDGDWNGTTTITIRAWDKTAGTSGQLFNITSAGGTSAFSATTAVGTVTINAVADATPDTFSGGNAALEDTPKVFNPISGTGGATPDNFEGNPQITSIAGQPIAPGGTVVVDNGTVTLAADGRTVTFQGSPNYTGTTTFSYTVTSGGVSESSNFTINVTNVDNDPPAIDLDTSTAGTGFVGTYDQEGERFGQQGTITDPEGQNLSSMTVTLVGATSFDTLRLAATIPGITPSYNSATGVLTCTRRLLTSTEQTVSW